MEGSHGSDLVRIKEAIGQTNRLVYINGAESGDDRSVVDVQLRKNRMEPKDSYTLLYVAGYVCMLHTRLPVSPARVWVSWSGLEQLTYAEE